MGRISRGMVIYLCGPDGTGKTTLAEALAEGHDAKTLQVHHKPEVLPYPGEDPHRDYAEPHASEPHGRLASLAKVGYLYLDWLLAWPIRFRQVSRRGGLVIVQRPWPDMIVDPRRYRLHISPRLLRALGKLLPKPDLTVLLAGAPSVIAERKGELDEDEIAAQNQAWREALTGLTNPLIVDVDREVDAIVELIRDVIATRARPRRHRHIFLQGGRWLLPRRPRDAAVTGIRVHQPMSTRDRARANLALAGARLGLAAMLPGSRPPPQLLSRMSHWLDDDATFAARRLGEGERWFVQIISPDGSPGPALKLALTESAAARIETEGQVIAQVATVVEPPLGTPRVLDFAEGVLVMESVPWRRRSQPLQLPLPVARGLGRLFAATAQRDDSAVTGRVHGDLAPWNVLWDGSGWVLLDWEDSRPDGEPFHDVFHHYVQSHALIGWPPADAIVAGAGGEGEIGLAVEVWGESANVDPALAVPAFTRYLIRSTRGLDPDARDFETARRRRRRLLELWDGGAAVLP